VDFRSAYDDGQCGAPPVITNVPVMLGMKAPAEGSSSAGLYRRGLRVLVRRTWVRSDATPDDARRPVGFKVALAPRWMLAMSS
jgi:hypothetical protein